MHFYLPNNPSSDWLLGSAFGLSLAPDSSECCPRAIFRQEYSPDLRVLILTDPDSGVRVLRVSVTGPGPGKGGAWGHSLLTSDTISRGGSVTGDRAIKHHVRNIGGSNKGIHRKCFDKQMNEGIKRYSACEVKTLFICS